MDYCSDSKELLQDIQRISFAQVLRYLEWAEACCAFKFIAQNTPPTYFGRLDIGTLREEESDS